MDLDVQKPVIKYPCKWEYRVIGENEEKLKELIFEVMPREYEVQSGKRSSSGHFVSVYAIIEVQNEEERNSIFAKLQASKDVKMVI
ncbi:DUF493 domain-containing protein [Helicobacter jaachi]|uniref:DUF493 domain-containing protein n=1 Tax=Helicobacter jaachi TaxID=1677920 RepID=A0A4U8TBR8_9HELI|nr:DUF493 domain-containing protein [Helicobacter jaachi]TLD97386.1 DUF493 domain-containing protein [Helicobacter jaachi]